MKDEVVQTISRTVQKNYHNLQIIHFFFRLLSHAKRSRSFFCQRMSCHAHHHNTAVHTTVHARGYTNRLGEACNKKVITLESSSTRKLIYLKAHLGGDQSARALHQIGTPRMFTQISKYSGFFCGREYQKCNMSDFNI